MAANRFSKYEIVALRKQCRGIVNCDSSAEVYVEGGRICDDLVDCLKMEIAVARDLVAEGEEEWIDRVPLLENLLAAAQQEFAEGKPIEPVTPDEFENAWKSGRL